ncbi:MAG: hypothetical protein VZQ98_09850 [Bacteroidales bacterium]|jgi:hypothetical protein|nr:hypothetical protein [Bacteroidales bacterium]
MDIISYVLSKRIAEGAVSGVRGMSVDGQTLNIECNDGTHLEMNFPTPADGASIVDVDITAQKHLICTLSDGNTIDAGEVPTVQGYSPQITVKKSTDTAYILHIKDIDSEYDTPNLRAGAESVEELTEEQVDDLLAIIQ